MHFIDTVYTLCGVNGEGFFRLSDVGPDRGSHSTACQRGFMCVYGVREDCLVLNAVETPLFIDDTGGVDELCQPKLFGKSPQKGLFLPLCYGPLQHPVPFTGGLLLGKDFIEELYVHMGFHPGYKYRQVVELMFHEGRLVRSCDRSDIMAAFREHEGKGYWDEGTDKVEDLHRLKAVDSSGD